VWNTRPQWCVELPLTAIDGTMNSGMGFETLTCEDLGATRLAATGADKRRFMSG
jgi:hypothetical protein